MKSNLRNEIKSYIIRLTFWQTSTGGVTAFPTCLTSCSGNLLNVQKADLIGIPERPCRNTEAF